MAKAKTADLPIPDVAHYEDMKDGFEHPDDPKPITTQAIRARDVAIREGRLNAPPRDECPPSDEEKKAKAKAEAEVAAANKAVIDAKIAAAKKK